MPAFDARYLSQLYRSARSAEDNKLAHLLTTARDQLERLPYAGELRRFVRNLYELREWWLILVPFLFWVGWRTYHAERRTILRQRARQQRNQHV